MQEWRNWQTRRLQVPVVARSCGFKSHLLHSFFCLSFKNASAFLLRDARHAMHDILLLRISAILPEAISDVGLTPTIDTDWLLATYRGGNHLTSDISRRHKPKIFSGNSHIIPLCSIDSLTCITYIYKIISFQQWIFS